MSAFRNLWLIYNIVMGGPIYACSNNFADRGSLKKKVNLPFSREVFHTVIMECVANINHEQ